MPSVARRPPPSARSSARPRGRRSCSRCLFAVGGTADGRDRARCSPRWSAGTSLIGIGEAVVTGLVVSAVRHLAAPTSSHGARGLAARTPRVTLGGPRIEERRMTPRRFLAGRAARRPAGRRGRQLLRQQPPRRPRARRRADRLPRLAPRSRRRHRAARSRTTAPRVSTTSGSAAASPGVAGRRLPRCSSAAACSGCCVVAVPGDRARTESAMGAGHGHRLHFHGALAVHRCAGAPQDPAAPGPSCSSWWPPRASWYAVFGGHLRCWSCVDRDRRGCRSADLHRRADGDRGAVRALRGPDPVHRRGPRVAYRCPELSLSESGLLAAWGLLAKGTLGRRSRR